MIVWPAELFTVFSTVEETYFTSELFSEPFHE